MRNAHCARYAASDKGKAWRKRYNATIRQALRARAAVQGAVRAGRMPRAKDVPCEIGSGCTGAHQWHHDSYRPGDRLKVRCLCVGHHKDWHNHNVVKGA